MKCSAPSLSHCYRKQHETGNVLILPGWENSGPSTGSRCGSSAMATGAWSSTTG